MTGQASAHTGNSDDTPQNPNIFSDDYAESFAESYADTDGAHSLRRSESPVSPISPHGRPDYEPHDTPSRPVIPSLQPIQPDRSPSIRQSLTKNTRSGTQQGDRVQETNNGPSSRGINTTIQPVGAHRSTSSASTHSFAGSQSPVSPGDGPSHPYGMYPQDLGMSRTASVATASTTRPSSFNPNSRAPAHPYSLYSQSISGDATDGNQTNAIPVGFPGTNRQFHRQIGPEGEEQDIIGPDGHTEQLPPYSRFPEESNHKTVAGGALPAIGESDGPNGQPTSPGASERTIERRDSRATGVSDTARLNTSSTTPTTPRDNFEQEPSEKRWSEKNWREKKRTRILGIPLWFVLLIVVTLVVIAAICGGVIGGVLGQLHAKHLKHVHSQTPAPDSTSGALPTATITETKLIDASPVTSTPPGLPPLPTGTFVSSIGNPAIQQPNCLPDPGQASAWNCSLTPDTLEITIDTSGSQPQMQLGAVPNSAMNYGAQPPHTNMTGLSLVWDTRDMSLGPAYQFQTLYQKLVILPAEAIQPPDSKFKRDAQYLSPEFGGGHFHDHMFDMHPYESRDLDSGSHLWFCYWPGTFLEAFVYVNESSTDSSSASSTSSTSTESITPPPSYPIPGSPPLTFPHGPANGAMPTGSPESYSSMSLYQQRGWHSLWDSPSKRDGSNSPGGSCPRKVKVEERRVELPGNDPYCIQMQYLDSNWTPATDEEGEQITIQLNEMDPSAPSPYGKRRRAVGDSTKKHKRGPLPNSCYCQWNNY